MNIRFEDDAVLLEKKPGFLDEFTWSFLATLDEHGINHTLISGYVAILFGRNRSSEDIDIIIAPLEKETFKEWWHSLKGYECLNTTDPDEAYDDYIRTGHAIRFAKEGTAIPNMEVKTPKTSVEEWVLRHQQRVVANNRQTIKISPLELQIAYKLFLASEKDLEDAVFLHELFKEHLDHDTLKTFVEELNVKHAYEEHLR